MPPFPFPLIGAPLFNLVIGSRCERFPSITGSHALQLLWAAGHPSLALLPSFFPSATIFPAASSGGLSAAILVTMRAFLFFQQRFSCCCLNWPHEFLTACCWPNSAG